MSLPSLEYSEFESVVNLLNQSNNENVYQTLMQKEDKTLNTINNVIKYYTNTNLEKEQFINLSIQDILIKFANTWKDVIEELKKVKDIYDVYNVLMKKDRKVYLGLLFILISLFIFFTI
jgi:hypothetical protein